MKFTLDTNILVYAVDADAGARYEMAYDLMKRSAVADCIILLQVLGEFFHATTRRAKLSIDEAVRYIDEWRAVFPVRSATEELMSDGVAAVRDHNLSFWDAMLWATANRAGCRYLLTEDFQDGRTLGGVTFIDPFRSTNVALLDALLSALPS